MRKNNKKQRKQLRPNRIRTLEFKTDSLVRRMTTSRIVSTGATGIVAVTTDLQSDYCQSLPSTEFASYAARFGQYRCIAMTLRVFPCIPSPTGGINLSAGALYFCDFIATTIPTLAINVLSDRGSKVFSSAQKFTYRVSGGKYANTKLWTPTSTAIPAANRFGIAYCSNASIQIMPITTQLLTMIVEHEIEFSQAQ